MTPFVLDSPAGTVSEELVHYTVVLRRLPGKPTTNAVVPRRNEKAGKDQETDNDSHTHQAEDGSLGSRDVVRGMQSVKADIPKVGTFGHNRIRVRPGGGGFFNGGRGGRVGGQTNRKGDEAPNGQTNQKGGGSSGGQAGRGGGGRGSGGQTNGGGSGLGQTNGQGSGHPPSRTTDSPPRGDSENDTTATASSNLSRPATSATTTAPNAGTSTEISTFTNPFANYSSATPPLSEGKPLSTVSTKTQAASSHNNADKIAGGLIGGLCVVFLIIMARFWFLRWRRRCLAKLYISRGSTDTSEQTAQWSTINSLGPSIVVQSTNHLNGRKFALFGAATSPASVDSRTSLNVSLPASYYDHNQASRRSWDETSSGLSSLGENPIY